MHLEISSSRCSRPHGWQYTCTLCDGTGRADDVAHLCAARRHPFAMPAFTVDRIHPWWAAVNCVTVERSLCGGYRRFVRTDHASPTTGKLLRADQAWVVCNRGTDNPSQHSSTCLDSLHCYAGLICIITQVAFTFIMHPLVASQHLQPQHAASYNAPS